MMQDNYIDSDSLRIEEEFPEIGTVIFEWDRSHHVIAYDERESKFRKEFILDDRSYNALFDLIDNIAENPRELMG